jgi:hypothetical protein
LAMRSRKLPPEAVVGFRADDVDVCESGRPANEFRGVDFAGATLGFACALEVAEVGASCFACDAAVGAVRRDEMLTGLVDSRGLEGTLEDAAG